MVPGENQDLQKLKQRIMLKLPEYLAEHGVEFTQRGNDPWFKCINPDHKDSDPSTHFVKGSEQRLSKCFPCGASYNIFHAAHIFEHKPLEGKAFIENNVYYLADKYKIPFERRELSEEELLLMRIQSTYEAAAAVLKDFCIKYPDTGFHFTRQRGFSDELCLKMGLGTIGWDYFLEGMKNYGRYSSTWIESVGINEYFIGTEFITIMMRDEQGRTVALARRWMLWNKEDKDFAKSSNRKYKPKYQNVNEEKCRIYRKESFVYGLYLAKKATKTTKRIDMVEGFTDVLALMDAGHQAVGATSGSSITDQQVDTIKSCGFVNINLVLDSDAAGTKGMEKHLKNLRGVEGLRPTIMVLGFEPGTPLSDQDPCAWIQKYGLENFMAQPTTSAFQWELNRLVNSMVEPKEIAHQMVDFLVGEPSAIERTHLINQLSIATGINAESIQDDVGKVIDKAVDEINIKMQRRFKRAKTSSEKAEILTEAAKSAEATTTDISKDELNIQSGITLVQEITHKMMNTAPGLAGWDCGMQGFNEHIGGIPKSKEILGFGGNANTGKSTILYNLVHGLLTNQNDGLTCIFWTLDDPVATMIAKLLAIFTGYPITHCRYPGSYGLTSDPTFLNAMGWIHDVIGSKKLVIRGIEIGNRPQNCERLIKSTQDETGNEVLVFVDGFHNMRGNSDDERLNFKRASEWMQKVSDMEDLTFLTSLECTKSGVGMPRISHIAESAKIQFAFKLIAMIFNDFHENRERAKDVWQDDDICRPILRFSFEKNKITDFKGDLFYKFIDDKAKLIEISKEEKDKLSSGGHEDLVRNLTGTSGVDITAGLASPLALPNQTVQAPGGNQNVFSSN